MINGIMLSCLKKDYSVRSKESSSSVFQLRLDFFFKRKEEQNSRGNRFPFAREGENLGERKEVGAKG